MIKKKMKKITLIAKLKINHRTYQLQLTNKSLKNKCLHLNFKFNNNKFKNLYLTL